MHFRSLLLAAIAATASIAHPGHDITVEALERRTFLQSTKRDLSHCSAKLEARGVIDRAVARRAEFGRRHAKRSWSPRQVRGGNQSHGSTADYTIDTPIGTIFGTNNTCILKPEATEGPYYVAGEHIRADITNQQPGVPFHLDVQVLDVETCEPVEKAYIEIWHCNSTGVYSGVTANGNGVAEDLTNLDNTAFRGIQLSDDDGVAQFSSKFPGHYTGRATHIHVMVHVNATAQTNGTINNLVASHVGQVYFDQDLIHRVEKEAVYLTNQQPLTLNSNDFLLKAENGSDPFVNYDLLGDAIADGLLGWITIAVNRTNEATRRIYNAATLTKDGGVRNPNGLPPPPPGGIFPPQ